MAARSRCPHDRGGDGAAAGEREPVGVHVGVERVLLLLTAEVVVERGRRLLHLHRQRAEPQDAGVLLRCLELK